MNRIFSIDGPVMGKVTKAVDCIYASFLWLIFSVPVITIGASSAALYTVVYKYLRNERGHLFNIFWNAFKENFKRSTIIWIITMLIQAVLIADVLVFRTFEIQGKALGKVYWVMLVICCIAVTWMVYVTAYSARFNGSVKDVLKFSFLMMTLHPLRALGVFLPVLCAAALTIIMPGLVLILPSLVFWICSITLEKVFLIHMSEEDAAKTTDDLKIQNEI